MSKVVMESMSGHGRRVIAGGGGYHRQQPGLVDAMQQTANHHSCMRWMLSFFLKKRESKFSLPSP
jgi:hypothetical protein